MSYSDWQWVPDFGMYFSQVGNVYARPDPYTGQWVYQSAGETSAAGAAAAAESQDVGWAMLADAEHSSSKSKGRPASPAGAAPAAVVSEAKPTSSSAILRLVALKSKILDPQEKVAVIDTREDGFILGRDKTHRPRIRLKELEVSKVHATVFFGDGKGSLDDEEGEEGFWLVDNGSTHGTFLLDPKQEVDPHRLSEPKRTSRPHRLHHMSRIIVGSTTFECHIHPSWPCDDCVLTDHNTIATEPDGPADLARDSKRGAGGAGQAEWKATEARQVALTSHDKRQDTARRSQLAMQKLRESFLGEEAGRQRWQGMKAGGKRKGVQGGAGGTAKRSREVSPAAERSTAERPLDSSNKGYAMLHNMAGGAGSGGAAPVTVKAVDGSAGIGSKKMLGISDVIAKGDGSGDWRKEAQARRWAELNGA